VALIRGLDGGLLPDLWNFPAAFGRTRAAALRHLREKLSALTGGIADAVEIRTPIAQVRHTITHRAIRVLLYRAEVHEKVLNKSAKWFTPSRLGRSAVSQLARKISSRLSASA